MVSGLFTQVFSVRGCVGVRVWVCGCSSVGVVVWVCECHKIIVKAVQQG